MRIGRIFLVALLALGLSPGVFVRSDVAPPDLTGSVEIRALAFDAVTNGPLSLGGLWHLTSENDGFGGYSALVSLGGDNFLAGSDAGRVLLLTRPDREGPAPEVSGFTGFSNDGWIRIDLESIVRDPQTGRFWSGIEGSNHIVRFNPDRTWSAAFKPPAMQDWANNSGAEAMVRLADGRIIVIAEEDRGDARHEALVFEGDPVRGAAPAGFTLIGETGYNPAEATLLPDGRVLVILRAFELGLPPYFSVKLATFDPQDIREGEAIALQPLSDLGRPFPQENFEGAVVMQEHGGDWAIWLISDDNFSKLQRTLLMRLDWPEAAR